MSDQSTPPEIPSEEPHAESAETNYAVGIALAIPLCVALGLTVFDNIGIGSLIGLAFAPIFAGFSKLKKDGDGS